MTKSEIIQILADSTIPEGATLIERELPFGITVSRISQNSTGGLQVMMARMFADSLRALTATLPEQADPALFEALHSAIVQNDEATIDAMTIPALEADVVATHHKVIERLRQIARDSNIRYKEPEDPLLE